jgi:defect-in-organelle-trafficking protein DotB
VTDQQDFTIPIPARADNAQTLDALLRQMVAINASDMFLLGSGEVCVTRYSQIHRLTRRRLSDSEVMNLLGIIYNTSAQSLLGAQTPIDTTYEFFGEPTDEEGLVIPRYRFRVNAVGCLRSSRNSLTVTMRTIPSAPPHWEAYGIEKEIIDVTSKLVQGLVLMVGGTGHGKSTALASILRERVEGPGKNIVMVTIEDPIEFTYDEINTPSAIISQLQVGLNLKSFYQGVKNSLRMAPKLILVGEARDFETVQAALTVAMTGHVVYTTVHANDVASTFQRLVYTYPGNMQNQAKLDVLQPMSLVMAQRLVPTVEGKRTALREILQLDQAGKDLLLSANDLPSAAFRLLDSHGKPMVASALEKFKDGLISKDTLKMIELNYSSLKADLKA